MSLSFKTYSQSEMVTTIRETARPIRDYVMERPKQVLLPVRERNADIAVPGAALVALMRKKDDPDHVHSTVIVAFQGDAELQYAFWCGDKSLDGALEKSKFQQSCAAAAALASPDYQGYLRERMESTYGMHPTNAACNFWKNQANGRSCKHIGHFFDSLANTNMAASRGMNVFLSGFSSEIQAMVPPQTRSA